MNEKTIFSTAKHLQLFLPAEEFIITGSAALYKYGLLKSVNDLDIILIKPKDETLEALDRLMKASPAKTKPKGRTTNRNT